MKVKVSQSTEDKLKFTLEGSNEKFSNALRRAVLSEVPSLAVKEATFIENNSAFYDEFIAHRLGLVPLEGETKGMNLPEECSCEGKGCSKCEVKFTLTEKGPTTVKSGDLKGPSKFSVADENIPLIKLEEGQKIKLEATAVLGRGKEHAKWQPGLISYSYDDPEKVEFTVESHGGKSPEEMVLGGAEILKDKAKEFKKLL